ncbi:hypothetical protein LCGC14_2224570 [marine sediment metagenome]|uniref:Uncharacterized protein n=1 Tax=marine sediment metagenome TaxID=412755 RepID=A0A0F9DA09_9ZZZZ
MSVWSDLLEVALPLVLKAAQGLADGQVDGATLSAKQKQYLYTAYVAIQVHGVDLVSNTQNPYDDMGIEALAVFAKDTLEEAGIRVPEIPVFEDPTAPNVVTGNIPGA